jgi:hypothetical protein
MEGGIVSGNGEALCTEKKGDEKLSYASRRNGN